MRLTRALVVAILAGTPFGETAYGNPARGDGREEGAASTRLYLFITPGDRDLGGLALEAHRVLAALARRKIKPDLRPVLLLSDFRAVGTLHRSEPFMNAVRDLRELVGSRFELGLYDEAGLKLAISLEIRRTPAWALVMRDSRAEKLRAHVAYGAGARIEEAVGCERR